FVAERSTVKLAGMRVERRLRHWRQVAISACEQCGRNRIPQVSLPATLPEWLDAHGSPSQNGNDAESFRLMLLPAAERGLRDLAGVCPPRRLILMVGPEGGRAPVEVAAAQAAGWMHPRLGKRTLQTERAAVAAMAGMQTLCGDY